MKNYIIPLLVCSVCFCVDSHAGSFFENITDENFREHVSVWELDNYHFYEPQPDSLWKTCTQAAKEGNSLIFDDCKLKEFKRKSDLDIKYYQIGFDSTLPIKNEWLYTVIQEVLNQEGFSYFTIYRTVSSIQNVDQDKSEKERNYKICQNNKKTKPIICVHTLNARILAYNDPEALRKGVIHDVGQKDGGLFMFYDIYTSAGTHTVEQNEYLWIENNTEQAWEVAQNVVPQKKNLEVKYNIQRHSESILAEHDNDPVDFSKEFKQCKKRFMDKNNGRFSEQNECYCNCVQDEVNKNVKKFDNPNKLAVDIIDTSYSHCDWVNSTMVRYLNERLEELLNKENLSEYDECSFKAYRKYIMPPVLSGSVNICNARDILSESVNCSSILAKYINLLK